MDTILHQFLRRFLSITIALPREKDSQSNDFPTYFSHILGRFSPHSPFTGVAIDLCV
jgi:hypothetical protein